MNSDDFSGMLHRVLSNKPTLMTALMMEAVSTVKRRSIYTKLHGAKSQKTVSHLQNKTVSVKCKITC
jgi:hypothetical protein